jgi:hypothetical protein
MTRRPFWRASAVIVVGATIGILVSIPVVNYQSRQNRTELLALLQPVALSNCQLERFGEANDGGYLMCGNLLRDVQSAYSYGIAGYDKWGCDISSRLPVPVHQYDCFNTTRPACSAGDTVFHAECVADSARIEEGRLFDAIHNQFAKNGDSSKSIVMKIDVEGAEWDSFLSAPDHVFEQIDQLAVEFHGSHQQKFVTVVRRLKEFFEVAHLHFNNFSCTDRLDPFPSWAYEVLFVNKRLAMVDHSRPAERPHPLDAPNTLTLPDCQAPI